MKHRLLLVLAAGSLLAGCAGLRGEVRVGPFPGCDTTSRGQLLLMAQSVPEASMIPCFGEFPPGWEFTGASTRTSRASLIVETDTFDLDVEVLLIAACDTAGAEQVSSDEVGAELYRVDGGRKLVYVFEGGCVRIVYPTAELAASSEGRALADEVHLMTRNDLRTLSGWEL